MVAELKPTRLFIIADGPRPGKNDEPLIQETKKIVENVSWPCEVTKIYSQENLGCNSRIVSGLNEVFQKVDQAIVLEDDCVPHPSFFPYCEALLEKYRDDERVMNISGNFFLKDFEIQSDYYFTRYPHCWGWATWRRAWNKLDSKMERWPQAKTEDILTGILPGKAAVIYWTSVFDRTSRGEINSWAYRWLLTCWLENGLSINPRHNLVTNIGFGKDATHTKTENPLLSDLEAHALNFPLTHPHFVLASQRADTLTENLIYSGGSTLDKIVKRIRHFQAGARS